jgi:hypothetical protein
LWKARADAAFAKPCKQAVKMTRLSCHRFRSNEVRLWLREPVPAADILIPRDAAVDGLAEQVGQRKLSVLPAS